MQARTFNDMIDFTRAGTATYVDVDGLLKTAAANVPRFDYTHGRRQLLLEGPATNATTYGGDLNNWVKASGIQVTAGAAAPIAGETWWHITTDDTNAQRVYSTPGVSLSDQSVMTGSLFIDASASDDGDEIFHLYFGQGGGWRVTALISIAGESLTITTADAAQMFALIGHSSTDLGNGFYRLSLTIKNISGVAQSIALGLWGRSDTIKTIVAWGAQIEVGSFPTSYIPTAGSAVTRAADQARLVEPVAALLRGGKASVLLQGEAVHGPSGRLLSGELATDFILAIPSDNQRLLGGYPTLEIATSISPPLPSFGLSVGWDADTFRGAYLGSSVQSRTGTQEADLSEVHIGRRSPGSYANGWYDQLVIWPFRMTDADLQRLAVPYA